MNKFMLIVYRGGNILLATQKNLAKQKRIRQKGNGNGNHKKKSQANGFGDGESLTQQPIHPSLADIPRKC